MERIFTYIAALFTRLLFCLHAIAMIYWLVTLKQDRMYFLFLLLLVALLVETIITVGFRKGHEYSWFCPSMFLYLMTMIPCDWIAKIEVLDCVASSNDASSTCITAVNETEEIFQFLQGINITDDERLLYTMEQALVLILVIGRWLLPKGGISRDQLSQLLLIYIGTAADIMEFTEIIKEDDIRKTNPKMLQNHHFVNAVILFWSVSLFQFPLTIYAMERSAQRLEKEKAELEERLRKVKEEKDFRRRRNQVAPSPALYIYKKDQSREYKEKEEIRVGYIQTKSGLEIKPVMTSVTSMDEEEAATHASRGRCNRCWKRFTQGVDNFAGKMKDYTELVSLLIPMLMQDGPFLVIRLIVIAYYQIYHDTLYFLTVKNALVVMLQVYRIFVLYYKPPEEDIDDFFPDSDGSHRLNNVQTAIKSVQHTRLALSLVSRLQQQAKWRRKRSLNSGRFKIKRPSHDPKDTDSKKDDMP